MAGPEAAPATTGRQSRVDSSSRSIRRAMVIDRGHGDSWECAGPCVEAGSRAIWSRECARACARERVQRSLIYAASTPRVRERVRRECERVQPHVPLGALGVAVVWPGLSRHTPISTLPGASLGATAICLMRRCLCTLGRPIPWAFIIPKCGGARVRLEWRSRWIGRSLGSGMRTGPEAAPVRKPLTPTPPA